MGPIIAYLERGDLPENPDMAKKIKKDAARYTIVADKLYRRGVSSPLLRCLAKEQAEYVMTEIHEGICGSHIGGRAVAAKVIRAGYYWPTLTSDCMNLVKRCDKCQQFADLHRAPPEVLHSITSPWPFNMWGADIIGPFPIAPGQVKFCSFLILFSPHDMCNNRTLAG